MASVPMQNTTETAVSQSARQPKKYIAPINAGISANATPYIIFGIDSVVRMCGGGLIINFGFDCACVSSIFYTVLVLGCLFF